MENSMSNIVNTVFSNPDGIPARNGHSQLTELHERHPTISVIICSGQRELMLGALQMMFAGGVEQSAIALPQVSPSDLGLTERQLDVLALMMQGKSNKMICRALNLAEPTVKNHVTAILRTLKVSNRTEAVIAVGELGWKLPANSAA
jgi:DNA-binding NarL/FixJ family response regulator